MMIEMGSELNVDANLLAAVILVELSGSGFVDEKLKIRFENHIFVSNAGYSDLFSYDTSKRWKGHKWRTNNSSEWQTVHTGSQTTEYAAFNFASTLDEDSAYNSISMGMGQIMGFNYAAASYNSAKEMYDDFSKGHEAQISGMSTFISNYNSGKTLKALQDGNIKSFVTQYNGSGQVDTYTKLIQQAL